MNRLLTTAVAAVLLGTVLGAGVTYLLAGGNEIGTASDASDERKPLYWVAPMDSNYRRDEPGKSPMGMDLIPVYEEDASAEGAGPGTVRISPDVVNNLGVRTALVEQGRLSSEIHTVGYVGYNQDELVHINPRIDGWIERLYVNTAGDRVQRGQPLYALYSPELVNAQQEFLQALSQGSQSFGRAAEDRLKTWQVSNDFIEQLRRDKKVQQTVIYYAPKAGYLETLNVRQGEFVQPGKVLMSIATLDDIWIEAEVFASQVHLVKAGLPATVTVDYLPGKTWEGEVDYVYPTLNPETRTLPVRLKFNNAEGQLKPAMFANVAIRAASDRDATLVPREAVIRLGQMDRVVLALGDGQFKSIAVSLGRSDGEYIEILEGVEPGERVVTSAQFLIDSESSKTSDFARLHHGDSDGGQGDGMEMENAETTPQAVSTKATVNTVMADHRMLNVTHAPIEAWGWPQMTMNFDVSENIDLSGLEPGLKVHLDLRDAGSGRYLITAIQILDGTHQDNASNAGGKKEGMNYGGMEAKP